MTRTLALAIVSLAVALPAAADPDPLAPIVYLRTSCELTSTPHAVVLDDCFTDTASLVAWIHSVRQPGPGAPLLVDVGPGDFEQFSCNGVSHITLRGAGRERSRFVNTHQGDDTAFAVDVLNCTELGLQDLTLAAAKVGIRWRGAGTSTYSNVDIVADLDTRETCGSGLFACDQGTWGWEDSCAVPGERSEHFWFGTRVLVEGGIYAVGFDTRCATHWFYGGEIRTSPSANASATIIATPVYMPSAGGDFRAYGSNLRAAPRPDATYSIGILAGVHNTNGILHMHGGIIAVDASAVELDQNVVGVYSGPTGMSHTLDTAFVVKPGGAGTATRVKVDGGGMAAAPLLWEARSAPPAVTSLSGLDLYVETDCGSSGNCDAGGSETHLMIYNSSCSASDPWFDSTTGRCRNVTAP